MRTMTRTTLLTAFVLSLAFAGGCTDSTNDSQETTPTDAGNTTPDDDTSGTPSNGSCLSNCTPGQDPICNGSNAEGCISTPDGCWRLVVVECEVDCQYSKPFSPMCVQCPQLEPDACLNNPSCVLDWEPHTYTCRAPENDCESHTDITSCEASSSCAWHPASCYCPPGDDCVCLPGPAAMCRSKDAVVTCLEQSPLVSGNGGCALGDVCCIEEGMQVGTCEAPDVCQ